MMSMDWRWLVLHGIGSIKRLIEKYDITSKDQVADIREFTMFTL
jgi:hypothetical protein